LAVVQRLVVRTASPFSVRNVRNGSSNISQTSKVSASSMESNLGNMVTFAMRNLEERHDYSEDDKAKLRRVFSQTLAADPMDRNTDIEELMYILTDEYGTMYHLKIFGLILQTLDPAK
jgi:hypothetical protein